MSKSSPVLHAYPCPKGAPASRDFEVHVNGQPAGVFANGPHSFAVLSLDDARADVSISCAFPVRDALVRPRAAGIRPARQGNVLRLSLNEPCKLSVEVNGGKNLFLFADPPEDTPTGRDAARVIRYDPGLHDLHGEDLVLRSGDTLHLSGGAYLANGRSLIVQDAENVLVCGRGVLQANTRVVNSRHVRLEGIVINPTHRAWMNKVEASQYVTYRNVKVLAGDDTVCNYDGFDVMSGCQDVHIRDVFCRATDDVLSVKHHPRTQPYWSSKAPIGRVSLTHSVIWTSRSGSFVRIGPETIGPSMDDILVQDIDVLHNQAGSVFEIRTVDGARIRNVRFENIRIEEDHQKLILFDMANWYKVGTQRGTVDGVYFRDITVRNGAGDSRVEGPVGSRRFKNVCFDNVRVDDALVTDWSQLGTEPCLGAEPRFQTDARPAFDTDAPVLQYVAAMATAADGTATRVFLTFSKPLAVGPAERAEAFHIDQGVRVHRAEVSAHFRQVVLTTDPLAPGATYTVTVDGLRDWYGNAMPEPSAAPLTVTPSWHASSAFADFQGRHGWYYEQFNWVARPVYSRQTRKTAPPSYWLMNFHPALAGGSWIGHDGHARITAATQRFSESHLSARTWRAPVAGRVRIQGAAAYPTGRADAFRLQVVHHPKADHRAEDGRALWTGSVTRDRPADHDVTVSIRAGEVVRFVAGQPGPAPQGAVAWDPVIAYVAE